MLLGIYYLQEAYLEELSPKTKERLKTAAKVAGALGGLAAIAGTGAAYVKGNELDPNHQHNALERIKMGAEYYLKKLHGDENSLNVPKEMVDDIKSNGEKGKSIIDYFKSKLNK